LDHIVLLRRGGKEEKGEGNRRGEKEEVEERR